MQNRDREDSRSATPSGSTTIMTASTPRVPLRRLHPRPHSADLDDAAKQALASAAIPVPEGVTRGVVRLADESRYDVPVVVICPEFTPAQAREWIGQGEVPELAKSSNVSFASIDSGHWPMISAPAGLARLLAQAAARS
jgi:pimeloyl-ACP methyl ester carboxylesterase